jgi:5-hydroxyisourate hydrolase
MISTHILDTSIGNPAAGVKVTLELFLNNEWKQIGEGCTNDDGRYAFDVERKEGKYRIHFFTQDYFQKSGTQHFFLDTPVAFNIVDTNRKYHVPLLVNPFGYSTYRGS